MKRAQIADLVGLGGVHGLPGGRVGEEVAQAGARVLCGKAHPEIDGPGAHGCIGHRRQLYVALFLLLCRAQLLRSRLTRIQKARPLQM